MPTSEKPFFCSICGKCCASKMALSAHRSRFHREITSLTQRKTSEVEKVHKCLHCLWRTADHNRLKRHIRDKHAEHTSPSKPKSFGCDRCERRSVSKTALKQHRSTYHRDVTSLRLNRISDEEKTYHCPLCPWKCPVMGELNRHIKRKHRERAVELMSNPIAVSLLGHLGSNLRAHRMALAQYDIGKGDGQVRQIEDTILLVQAVEVPNGQEDWHIVTFKGPCSCIPQQRCRNCGLCSDEYSCDCPEGLKSGLDELKPGRTCKHMHAAHIFRLRKMGIFNYDPNKHYLMDSSTENGSMNDSKLVDQVLRRDISDKIYQIYAGRDESYETESEFDLLKDIEIQIDQEQECPSGSSQEARQQFNVMLNDLNDHVNAEEFNTIDWKTAVGDLNRVLDHFKYFDGIKIPINLRSDDELSDELIQEDMYEYN